MVSPEIIPVVQEVVRGGEAGEVGGKGLQKGGLSGPSCPYEYDRSGLSVFGRIWGRGELHVLAGQGEFVGVETTIEVVLELTGEWDPISNVMVLLFL